MGNEKEKISLTGETQTVNTSTGTKRACCEAGGHSRSHSRRRG